MKPSTQVIGLIVLCAALASAPFAGEYVLGIIAEILIFAIFAMSLGLLIGYTGLLSFGHAAFFGISSYAVITLGVHLGLSGWWGLAAGVTISAITAAIIGAFCIRVNGIAFLMLTMAFAQLLYSVSLKWRSVTGGTDGLVGFERPSLFSLSLNDPIAIYGVIATGFILVLIFLWCLVRSPLGSIFIGIRDNEQRMQAIGYPVQRFKLIAFTIAGALAGFGGALYAFFNAYISSETLHWTLSGDAIIMVVLGGSATVIGPALGAAIFLLLKNILSSHTEYWQFWIGAIFIFSVMFLREGAWGFIMKRIQAIIEKRR
ncbi:branched-chain amino acid ABC transporter permease [Paralcaligenes ureilyticus]|uniref:Amino acid/amide ABC transporter membrane protein 2 (HAAT family) n=1 Tax=Paralcaligenes ureilyticus TaxID=627131 RepID=A0A4R3M8K5_9BURK|nr:branched-chain amino acid ABC transporter permease [Paralcaligenes ureilyticus]TCT09432.1 amino acid/amide ABC transporter membrane protein 2 (HAAT family) [Paralcaligenes ureilyticus]